MITSMLPRRLFIFFSVVTMTFQTVMPTATAIASETKRISMWETAEWSLHNPSWKGNPFDLEAEVRFVNRRDGKTQRVAMYYAGDNTWKFRMTATGRGTWDYTTSSEDGDLDGRSGSVVVTASIDNDSMGFLTHSGNRFAIWRGNAPRLEAYRFVVYMNKKLYPGFDDELDDEPWTKSPLFQFEDPAHLAGYLDEARQNGFQTIFLHPGFPQVWTDGTNPRLATFTLLENILKTVRKLGMRAHIWMWGDHSRRATPKEFDSGINGEEDRRLQRYIAARLGPLPGWSLGYGFDLHEWTDENALNDWAAYFQRQPGWNHLLSARGMILKGANTINAYGSFNNDVSLTTTKYGPKDYHEIVEDLESDSTRPHLYSERHTFQRPRFHLDMQATVRLLWRQMIAGGMGGWFGFHDFSAYPYPHPERLRCAERFWQRYFSLDMVRDNSISDGYALTSTKNDLSIIYKERSEHIQLNLPSQQYPIRLLAVDTQKAYKELPISVPDKNKTTVDMPCLSDWAVIVATKGG